MLCLSLRRIFYPGKKSKLRGKNQALYRKGHDINADKRFEIFTAHHVLFGPDHRMCTTCLSGNVTSLTFDTKCVQISTQTALNNVFKSAANVESINK